MIEINKPRIVDNGEFTRLESDIVIDGKTYNVWYEVEKEYGEYLCDEKADAFLITVLPYAMSFKKDIVVKDVPISESIMWHLVYEYIPVLAKYSGFYHSINIDAKTTTVKYDSYAVGTGFSAGVDSFYTVLRNHNDSPFDGHKLTHLTFFNVGACGYGNTGGERAMKVFKERTGLFKEIVQKLGLKYVIVNSNTYDFLPLRYNYIHSFRSMSAVLALQKLFSTYYYSSDGPLEMFTLEPDDCGYYDLLNIDCFSTESTRIESVGMWERRIDKVQYISKYPITYDILNVCNTHATNCTSCDKCLRTMGDLYAVGALEKYRKVFDVDYFMNNLTYCFRRIITKAFDGSVEASYNKEIYQEAKKNGYRVPKLSFIAAMPYAAIEYAKGVARRTKWGKRYVFKKRNKNEGWHMNTDF